MPLNILAPRCMDELHREALRERLERFAGERRAALACTIRTLTTGGEDGAEGRGSLALERQADALALVLDALRRVDSADFGYCRECGDAIDFRRLEAEPEALRCVECETRREHIHPLPHASS